MNYCAGEWLDAAQRVRFLPRPGNMSNRKVRDVPLRCGTPQALLKDIAAVAKCSHEIGGASRAALPPPA